jgi:hypothetical protein
MNYEFFEIEDEGGTTQYVTVFHNENYAETFEANENNSRYLHFLEQLSNESS